MPPNTVPTTASHVCYFGNFAEPFLSLKMKNGRVQILRAEMMDARPSAVEERKTSNESRVFFDSRDGELVGPSGGETLLTIFRWSFFSIGKDNNFECKGKVVRELRTLRRKQDL